MRPREATDRFVVDLGPFLESKRGPKRPNNRPQIGPTRVKLSAETLQEAFLESSKTL